MVHEQQPQLNISTRGKVRVVEFEDRKILDDFVINQIGTQLTDLVNENPEPWIVLDFKNVEHLSSAALGVLITLDKQIAECQGKLALANIQPQIFEVFKITRLNKLFNIQNTTSAAVESLSS